MHKRLHLTASSSKSAAERMLLFKLFWGLESYELSAKHRLDVTVKRATARQQAHLGSVALSLHRMQGPTYVYRGPACFFNLCCGT